MSTVISNTVTSNKLGAGGKSMNTTDIESLPWYRYSMVWMVILLPLSVVIASIVTITIAFNNAPMIVKPVAPTTVQSSNSSVDRNQQNLEQQHVRDKIN